MSKEVKKKVAPKILKEEQPFIPEKYQDVAAIALILVSIMIFLSPVIFGGKTFVDADTIASHSFDTFVRDAAKDGLFPLWNPYIFCGMPAYGSLTVGGERLYDISAYLFGRVDSYFHIAMFNSPVGWVIFYYVIFGIGMYLLAFSKVQSRLAALIASLGAVFSMYIIIWVMVGHNTKISVIAFFPFIFFMLEKLRARWDWLYAITLVFVLHFAFLPSHVQMIFYMYLAFGIYLLFLLIRQLVKKEEWKGTIRTGLVLAAVTIIAFGMDADKYLSVLEYNPYSIRGMAPTVVDNGQTPKADQASPSQGTGLDYEYATSWSLAPGEMMTFIIPSWYGFGLHPYRGVLTRDQEFRLNTYWGPQPFTHAPQYMGIVILVLAIIGLVRNRKDPFVQYLGIAIIFSLLVAFGKEFPPIYNLMFNYFPFFNKFRVPSMILTLVQIFVPLLAAFGIASLLKDRTASMPLDKERRWKFILGGLAGFFALTIVLRGLFESIFQGVFPMQEVGGSIGRAVGSNDPNIVSELYKFVVDAVMIDIYFGVVSLLLVFGAFYFYIRNAVKLPVLAFVLILVVVADLWRVDKKPMEPKPAQEQANIFATPDYVQAMKTDTSLFRVIRMQDGQVPYDNTLAYWRIHNAYGYQGAKMRWYQDMVEAAGLSNPIVWQLMNIKYIVSNKDINHPYLQLAFAGKEQKVYRFVGSLPRAFFVKKVETASGTDILKKIANVSFDPREVAYMIDKPDFQIDSTIEGGTATFTHFGIQDFSLNVTAPARNLLFLSETYYPVGWKAHLDGTEIPIYRANYLFRTVVVPPGSHRLEMKFTPRGFYLGKYISLITNLVGIGGLGTIIYFKRKKKPA
jgi:hypothetical protein